MRYDDLTQEELFSATDLSVMYDDEGTILDEIEENDRFIPLDEWLEIDNEDYRKYWWGLLELWKM